VNTRVRRSSPLLSYALLTAMGLAAGAAALVWTRTEILSLRYEQSRLLGRVAELRGEVEKLRVEEAALSAPDRIERRARVLGLRYPAAGQVIVSGGSP
jgi:cell division protein FtsL